jgi:hypothetical protein
MEPILVAVMFALPMSVAFWGMAKTIAKVSEHNARLTYDALRMIQSKSYQDFAVGERIESHTRRSERYVPRGPTPEQEKARQAHEEWERAYEQPNSIIEE